MSVSIILISTGEALSQVSRFKLCYAVCVLVWAIAGFILGQIRTLQKFGFLANFAIWINLLIMFITMGVAAHSAPLYSAYTASAGYSINPDLVTPNAAGVFPPVQQSGGLPNQANFGASINGLLNAVYAYSGTQLFIDFMAEMTNPRDFLKSMWGSQLFIYVCYMLYGLFMYGYQGQYVQNPSYLGISPYAWSTTGNVLAMVTALIAAALYGNIGLKGMFLPNLGILALTYNSRLQQHWRPDLQSTTALHQKRQVDLGWHGPNLLVHCIRRRRRYSSLLRFCRTRLSSLRHAIHVLVSAVTVHGIHDTKECDSSW